MTTAKYLIIGGGIAADAAIAGIRELDPNGPITLVGAERTPPYNRPPLSKALWKGEPLESIERHSSREGAELVLGRSITRLDLEERVAFDSAGETHRFERVLLATGGAPRQFPHGGDAVIHFRTRDDYRRLRELTGPGRTFLVIGGGFIGCELAAALAMNGQGVHLVVPENGLGARVFPAELSQALVGFYEAKGVRVHAGTKVESLERRGARLLARLSGGATLEVDGAVAGIGLVPNDALARLSGLAVNDGIVVDERLRTSHPAAFAAGDVANLRGLAGARMRFEHEDAALTQGRLAGRNMAGADEPYRHVPMFYSDLFDLGYEAVGRVDARLATFADWKEPNRAGVVYYLEGERVRGVLLVNTWGKVDEARALLASDERVTPASLKGRIAG